MRNSETGSLEPIIENSVDNPVNRSKIEIFAERLSECVLSSEFRKSLISLESKLKVATDSTSLFSAISLGMQEITKFRTNPELSQSVTVVLDILNFIRLNSKKPQLASVLFGEILQRQKVKFDAEQAIERNFDAQIESLILEYAQKINEGKNGVIFRLDIKSVPKKVLEELKDQGLDLTDGDQEKAVAKVFKIFDPAAAEHEIEMQRKVYSITENADPAKYAKVPRPWFVRSVSIEDPQVVAKLQQGGILQRGGSFKGVKGPENKISIFMMDLIEGDDVATHLYKWILKNKNFDEDEINNMNFYDLQTMVQTQLGFQRGSGAGSEQEDFQVANKNSKKLFAFLTQKGFKINPQVAAQIRNTIGLWRRKGFYHNDLHLRNIMVSGDIEKGDAVTSMIDFGTGDSSQHENADDFAALNTLERI